MKTKRIYNFLICLIMVCVSPAMAQSGLVTLDKTYNYDYVVDKGKLLDFDNQFGKMHIETWDGDKVSVEVIVTVTQRNEDRANSILQGISIQAVEGKSSISIKTNINGKSNNRGGETFRIEYFVKMPKTNPLRAKQSFGEMYIGDLNGNADINVSYGSIKAGVLGGNNSIKISFSNGEIATSKEGSMEVKYSKLEVGSVDNLQLDQQFSDINIEKAGNITLDAKYGSLNFGEVGKIRGSTSYSGFKVNHLLKSIDLSTTYGGGVDIRKVSSGFESIDLWGKFTGFNIYLSEGTNARFDIDTEYCELRTMKENITFQTRIKEMNKGQYQGTIGKGGNLIRISSSYGDIKLQN